jgi:hypothetical protein
MGHPKYLMGDIFLDGFPLLMENCYIHEKLFEKVLPKLFVHFQDEGIISTMYSTKWYMLYMIECLPFELVLKIWDIYFSEGSNVIFKVVIGLLQLYEKVLLKKNFEEIMHFFREFDRVPIDVDNFMKYILKIDISDSDILSCKSSYQSF